VCSFQPQRLDTPHGPLPASATQNARALLRNALPIKNKQIRVAQQALESITDDLRVPGVRFSVRLPVLSTELFPLRFAYAHSHALLHVRGWRAA